MLAALRGAWPRGHRLAGDRLGIALQDSNVQPPAPNHTGDFKKKLSASGGYEIGPDGNFVADGSEPGALDIITGGETDDHMQGLGADDAMAGLDGADLMDGGDGNDVLMGGLGSDVVHGGEDMDDFVGMGELHRKGDTRSRAASHHRDRCPWSRRAPAGVSDGAPSFRV